MPCNFSSFMVNWCIEPSTGIGKDLRFIKTFAQINHLGIHQVKQIQLHQAMIYLTSLAAAGLGTGPVSNTKSCSLYGIEPERWHLCDEKTLAGHWKFITTNFTWFRESSLLISFLFLLSTIASPFHSSDIWYGYGTGTNPVTSLIVITGVDKIYIPFTSFPVSLLCEK